MNAIINPFSEKHIDTTLLHEAKEALRNIWLKRTSRVLRKTEMTNHPPSLSTGSAISTKVILLAQSSSHDLLNCISDAQQCKLKSRRSRDTVPLS